MLTVQCLAFLSLASQAKLLKSILSFILGVGGSCFLVTAARDLALSFSWLANTAASTRPRMSLDWDKMD